MAVSPHRNGFRNRDTSGPPLDGLSGLAPVFQTFYIQVWNKYDTLVPHPAYIYFIKMPANPDNPSRFLPSPLSGSLRKTPLRFN